MSSTMNRRIAQVFTLLGVGFGGIVVLLTWWQVVVAGELRQKDLNNQTAYYEQRVARGFITTADGVRLAGRVSKEGANGDTIWSRRYPAGTLAAHVLGYDTRGHSRAGVERAMNDSLTGSTRNLGAVVGLLDGNDAAIGDDVRLTIDSKAQQVAQDDLDVRKGAVVAIEPDTGRILVAASAPTFRNQQAITNFDAITAGGGSALLNRATQGAYPPGSTFKLVTTTAALENGESPDRTFEGGTVFKVPGEDIHNYAGEVAPRGHTLAEALTHSYNTTFAQLGTELGDSAMREQMAKFGFFERPPVEALPASEVRASGLYDSQGNQLKPETAVDVARVAIGQERLLVTPLQMALVTAAIANDGKVPEPTLLDEVTRPGGGRTVRSGRQATWKTAMSPQTASELTRMMESVVEEGTGTAVRLPGIDIAGKTGTADVGAGKLVAWFVAFAPANDPKVAIAVAIEDVPSGGTGGTVAAPIARDVLAQLLQAGSGA
ncbi:MAG: penicillin-binding protein 2 [Thermoleophilia bacterium]|nr:penicillin-binding protein 2 [Thermoleophilia bacterium]